MTNNASIIHRIRQNHALEHATVSTLSRWQPGIQLVGRSDWSGFWLYGNASTSMVRDAMIHGLATLQAGHAECALHPRCGTNMATGILLASAAGVLTSRTAKRSHMMGLVCGLASLWTALKLARPLGMVVQQHVTTTSNLGNLAIKGLSKSVQGDLVVHHIMTGNKA